MGRDPIFGELFDRKRKGWRFESRKSGRASSDSVVFLTGSFYPYKFLFPDRSFLQMPKKIANVIDCLKNEPLSKRAVIPIPYNSEVRISKRPKNEAVESGHRADAENI